MAERDGRWRRRTPDLRPCRCRQHSVATANAHTRIHFAREVFGFSLARRALILHLVFIYVSVERRFYRWRRRGRCGPARGRGRAGGGHTYYVINPHPPRRRALRTRAGFPRPRASRPLTTHGAPRSAAASRSATRADVALYSVASSSHRPMISFMLISAR